MFARAVNENETIKAALQDVILFPNDCEKGEGIEIAKKYGVRGYPTFIAVDSKGEITDRWIGYDGPEIWSANALAAAGDPRLLTVKKAAYEAAPTAALAQSLANDASTGYDFVAAVGFLRQARELDPGMTAAYTHQILTYMSYGADSGAFSFDDVEAEAKPALSHPAAMPAQKVELALMMSGLAGQAGTPERAVPYITEAMRASEGETDEGLLRRREGLAIQHALLVEHDKGKALGLFRASLPEDWQDSPRRLNQFAWWCFENDTNLDEALQMALRGVELAEDDGDRANVLDTAAEICNKLGNCDEAVAHMQRAVELDPDKEYFKEQLVRFQEAAAEKSRG